MSDSILERLTGRNEAPHPKADEHETEDLQCFGWLRGARKRAIMLELRHRNGNITAFGNAWLEKAELDPSEGITLQFGGKTVRIIGTSLNYEIWPNISLFQSIVRHRVPWIRESEFGEIDSLKTKVSVDEIRL
jgi:hypothetical protein